MRQWGRELHASARLETMAGSSTVTGHPLEEATRKRVRRARKRGSTDLERIAAAGKHDRLGHLGR